MSRKLAVLAAGVTLMVACQTAMSSADLVGPTNVGMHRVERINYLWVVIHADTAGHEQIVHALTTDGVYLPLVAADDARLESILPVARKLAASTNWKMNVVKFVARIDVGEIEPEAPSAIEPDLQ